MTKNNPNLANIVEAVTGRTPIAKVVSKTSMNGAMNVIKYDILKGQPTRLAGGLTINHTTGTYQKDSGKTKI